MHWEFTSTARPRTVAEVIQLVLTNRGVEDKQSFFSPPKPSQYELTELGFQPDAFAATVARLREAGANHEQVLIFGDYDADGICATTVLWQSLHALGCVARPFIPDRIRHGYGLTIPAIKEAVIDFKPDLVVTVDNGIVAFPALEYLREQQIPAIVTDHHQPEFDEQNKPVFPPTVATAHSTVVCGTTIAWMLSHHLTPELAEEQLDFCAIATVADLVPLQGCNRSFVLHGLEQLRHTTNVGLQQLLKTAGVAPPACTTETIGFILGPRINAMGRLAHGMDALRLLCTKQPNSAERLARVLEVTNGKRQSLTEELLEEAIAQAEQSSDQHITVVASESFHEGVVGLIAGKLVEKYAKPAVAISISGSVAKASARSFPGVNIVELLRQVRDQLLEVGGHPMAAGFGVATEDIAAVTRRLQKLAKELILPEQLVPRVQIDCVLDAALVSSELADQLSTLQPFGKANEEPVFVIEHVRIESMRAFGKEGAHCRMELSLEVPNLQFEALGTKSSRSSSPRTNRVSAVFWRGMERVGNLAVGEYCSVAASLQWNDWNGTRTLQLLVADIQQAT